MKTCDPFDQVALLMEVLVREGVEQVFLCPGSRCTPLVMAFAGDHRFHLTGHVDERGAAFAALGCARASNKPVVWVTTSGTAVANGLPAAVEAFLEDVPLILLTADRPSSMLNTGANQTIFQQDIFGRYARACVDVDLEKGVFPVEALRAALFEAKSGPIHINTRFAKPLEGVGHLPSDFVWNPVKKVRLPAVSIPSSIDVVMVGGLFDPVVQQAVLEACERNQVPMLVDVCSGFVGRSALVVHQLDQLKKVDTVLYVGGRLVDFSLWEHLQSLNASVFHLTTSSQVQDPLQIGVVRLEGDVVASLTSWQNEPVAWLRPPLPAPEMGWTEAALAETLLDVLPAGHGLFLGNSLCVRMMNKVVGSRYPRTRVMANRGASGIDGNISSAVGASMGWGVPVTAYMGDLTALHDLNALLMLRIGDVPVRLVIVNNNGGGIFHRLPISNYPDVFEPWFVTPHGVCFEGAAGMFGLSYARVGDRAAFVDAYASGTRVIEAVFEAEVAR